MNLLTPLRASADARQEKLAAQQSAKLREAQTASETLKSRSSEASEERKAAARQKIEQLKARLQMLRSMVGVDPEGIARIAAQLARELGAAVKAYASAGGNTAGMSATGAPAVASTDAGAAGAAGAEGQAGAQSDAQSNAQAQPEATSGAAEQQGPAKGGSGEETKSSNPYQQAIDEQKSQAAESARRSGEKQADSELMAEVRRMAAELKTLIKQATDKAKAGEPDAVSPQEARELDGAAAELDRAVQQAGADLGGGLVSLLV
ncbi:hypothetical protein [Brevundimonas sp. GCM10030266]|uniref:hypothetical protein n=1 Tax=Brevundimonas sp. GCM10030266 TaxID=3273386 RepID=UPI00366E35CB